MTESSRTEVITVSVIDDDANIRNGLSWLLNNIVGLSCLETYTSYPEAQKGLDQKTPDILLLDISLPGISGIEAIQPIRKRFPEMKIIMHSNYDEDEKIARSIRAGASGYVLKNASASWLHHAILKVVQGDSVWPPGYSERTLPANPQSLLQKATRCFKLFIK